MCVLAFILEWPVCFHLSLGAGSSTIGASGACAEPDLVLGSLEADVALDPVEGRQPAAASRRVSRPGTAEVRRLERHDHKRRGAKLLQAVHDLPS